MQGCTIKPGCVYCDTKQSQDKEKGTELSVKDVYRKVQSLKLKNITITGGEPLLQEEELLELIKMLNLGGNYIVSIETNGSCKIPHWGGWVSSWIADWKGPSSGARSKMNFKNLEEIRTQDYLKFVIGNEEDFLDAVSVMKKITRTNFMSVPHFAFSPMFGKMNPTTLLKRMYQEKLCIKYNAILNLQLHKMINVS
jgi:7-carboxy-7-deazaguanine synthase